MTAAGSIGVATGQVLSGKYRLEAQIGRGGMGEVFAATQLATGKHVAVKVVSRAGFGDLMMQRLHREAVAAGRIESEFVPHVFDVDRTAEGEVFLVMELLRGRSLSERLKERAGFLSWEEAHKIGDDVLCGLIDAHAAGVVHRDLKPANIFLEDVVTGGQVTRERSRILDFGVCKLDGPDTEKLTTTGEAVGTVSYMAPEQIRGASRVDERADVYSFGVVMFEIVCGRLPYDAQGQIAILASKLERRARPVKDLARVAVPSALAALLAKALERKAADRWASAAELLKAWRTLGPATTAPPPVASAGDIGSPPAMPTGMTSGTIRDATYASYASRSRVGLLIALAGLVLASAVLIVATLRPPGAHVTVPVAPARVDLPAAPSDADAGADGDRADVAPPLASSGEAPRVDPAPHPSPRPPHASSRPRPPRAPKKPAASDGPHITTQPRY